MKNNYKWTGITALIIAVALFSMESCKEPGGDDPVRVTGVTLNQAALSIQMGKTATLTAIVAPANADNSAVTWTSSNTAVAEVNNGIVTGVSAGTANITVTTVDGDKKAACTVTVTASSSDITYTATQTGGVDGTADSTGIVFTFSVSVDSLGLTAADITVSGTASKGSGALSGSGTSRTLPITVNSTGLATVKITKSGVETAENSVIVYKAGQTVPEYWSITWNLNGGTAGTGAQHPTHIVKGTVLAKPSPDPAKADNNFGGWYTDSGLTQAYNFTNTVTANLSLYAKWELSTETTVPSGTLVQKLAWLSSNAASNTTYDIEVSADEAIDPQTLSYTGKSNITIILKGTGAVRTVSLSSNGSLFTVASGVKLVLDENITLQGHSSNNASLVIVNSGGALEMKTGAKITGNNISSSSSGGVYVGGTFTMNGGEISGNTSSAASGGVGVSGTFTMNGGKISGNNAYTYGGGVYVGGTFTMNGGEISGNNANGVGGGVYLIEGTFIMNGGEISGNNSNYGSGVYVGNKSIFTMNGGEISGNNAQSYGGGVFIRDDNSIFRIVTGTIYGSDETNTNLRNNVVSSAGSGAVLYVSKDTAQRGIFNGTTWNSYGILSITNNTIKVENGRLEGAVDIDRIAAPTWRDGDTVSLNAPTVHPTAGQTVTVQGWQISDTGSSNWSDFTQLTADISYNGKYLRYYATTDSQTYYSNTVIIHIYASDFHPSEATIAMWCNYLDGWTASAALRININGTDRATNARLAKGRGPGYDTFTVDSGDVVQIYWVNGDSYDYLYAFAVYYSDDLPNPAFSPDGTDAVDSERLLVYRQYSVSGSAAFGNGTLMGEFIVP